MFFSSVEIRNRAIAELVNIADSLCRNYQRESFPTFARALNACLFGLMNSPDIQKKITALTAISALLEVDYDEYSARELHFTKVILQACTSSLPELSYHAARAFGKLAFCVGAPGNENVEKTIAYALDCLVKDDKNAKMIGVLLCKEIAHNSPVLFYNHIGCFIERIWCVLAYKNYEVRMEAYFALEACLQLCSQRENSTKAEWYTTILNGANERVKMSSVEDIHGALNAYNVLIYLAHGFAKKHIDEFMPAVLRHKDHKERSIRRNVLDILCKIAQIDTQIFVTTYLDTAVKCFLNVIKTPDERDVAFLLMGEIALCVGEEIRPYLDTILSATRYNINPRVKGGMAKMAIPFVGVLCNALPLEVMQEHIKPLYTQIASTGLSAHFITALILGIKAYGRPMFDFAEKALLKIILNIVKLYRESCDPVLGPKVRKSESFREINRLAGAEFYVLRFTSRLTPLLLEVGKDIDPVLDNTAPMKQEQMYNIAPIRYPETGAILLGLLALSAVGIDVGDSAEYIRDNISIFINDDNSQLRIAAAATSATLVQHISAKVDPSNMGSHAAKVTVEHLEKLVTLAVTDVDPNIRRSTLKLFTENLDPFLCNGKFLNYLFPLLNDEDVKVQEQAIILLGRLSEKNPSIIMPKMRRTMLQLIDELNYGGQRSKENAAILCGVLFKACPSLTSPYVDSIVNTFLLLIGGRCTPQTEVNIIEAFGELALVGKEALIPFIPNVCAVATKIILDPSGVQKSDRKKVNVLRMLCKFVLSVSHIRSPIDLFPQVFGIVVTQLTNETNPVIRNELMRLLGVFGAVDPDLYKEAMPAPSQQPASVETKDIAENKLIDIPPSSDPLYCPAIVISALVKVINDENLFVYHLEAIKAVVNTLYSIAPKYTVFLPCVMPTMFNVYQNTTRPNRRLYLEQIISLVRLIESSLRDYLEEVVDLIVMSWNQEDSIGLLVLIKEVNKAVNDDFQEHLPRLLTLMINEMTSDVMPKRAKTMLVLEAIESLGLNLQPHLTIVIPYIMDFIENVDSRSACVVALGTMARLSKILNFSDVFSRIIRPLLRCLTDPRKEDVLDEVLQLVNILIMTQGPCMDVFIPVLESILTKIRVKSTILSETIAQKKSFSVWSAAKDYAGVQHIISWCPKPNMKCANILGSYIHNSGIEAQRTRSASDGGLIAHSVSTDDHGSVFFQSMIDGKLDEFTKAEWVENIRQYELSFLQKAPSPALNECVKIANEYQPLLRELACCAFLTYWDAVSQDKKDDVVRVFESCLSSPGIPPECVQSLLKIAEYMDHEEKPLPIAALGSLAQQGKHYAKALRWKELQLRQENSIEIAEDLININSALKQYLPAMGILTFTENTHHVNMKEALYEKLGRWEDALAVYENKSKTSLAQDVTFPGGVETFVGKMRCLHALNEWPTLLEQCEEKWDLEGDEDVKSDIAPYAVAAAWHLGEWENMEKYCSFLDDDSSTGCLSRTILAIRNDDNRLAKRLIKKARDILGGEIMTVLAESYDRAYFAVGRLHLLSELEEVIVYKTASPELKKRMHESWNNKLLSCKKDIETWQNLLSAHTLVIPRKDNVTMWLKFASICKSKKKFEQAFAIIGSLAPSPINAKNATDFAPNCPDVVFSFVKTMWSAADTPESMNEAYKVLLKFRDALTEAVIRQTTSHTRSTVNGADGMYVHLMARVHHKLGKWAYEIAQRTNTLNETTIPHILESFRATTHLEPTWYKAWRSWAVFLTNIISFYENDPTFAGDVANYVVQAVHAFFKAISLTDRTIQDTLSLLSLLFRYGTDTRVEQTLMDGFGSVKIDTWLFVVPQIIARLGSRENSLQRLTMHLLSMVGKFHPHPLVYPLTVAQKSTNQTKVKNANQLLLRMRETYPHLVDQALLVSKELIRVSILWYELWKDCLEEACRLYYKNSDVMGMFQTLLPLYTMLNEGPETVHETTFVEAYGHDLRDAWDYALRFKQSSNPAYIDRAWEIYQKVYRKIASVLPKITVLDLRHVSPELEELRNMELAVPGTYTGRDNIVRISRVVPQLKVIDSKQRPRKLKISGSNGKTYKYLLKGHEDLRQDERVMQLFNLINALLSMDTDTSPYHLSICCFAVIPLSPNSGIIGWVPHSDTMHALIREFRDQRNISLNLEHQLMTTFCPHYDKLCTMQKVEVLKYAIDNTDGRDLETILWLKSPTAEAWLDKRTAYTRSVAVMSMAGYILGLGDRHPNNIMIDRNSGQVVHIDFGDCFEVAMTREKYPERIPFRLTRMLINAMEVSGIEGTFRLTCESVMSVLRQNRSSLMTVLEAFVYDPLINWRTFTKQDDVQPFMRPVTPSQPEDEPPEAVSEAQNEKAVAIMKRISHKLTGTDFGSEPLDVGDQVDRLIKQATALENLCQSYVGWCPFW